MTKLSYNSWMNYINNYLTNLGNKPTSDHYKFGKIGQRTETQIQEEIEYLRRLDSNISISVDNREINSKAIFKTFKGLC